MTLINWHCHPGLTLLLPTNNNIHLLPPCEDAPLLIWSEGTNNINKVLSWLWFAQKFWWDAANLNEERRGRQGQRRKMMILCPTRHEKSTKHRVVKKPQKAVPADDPLWFPRIGMLRLDLLTWLWETIQLDWPTFRWKRDCKVSSHDSVADCKRLNYLVAKHLSFLDWALKGEGLKFLHCSVVCSPFNHTGRQWDHQHFWCLRLTTSFPSS